MMNGMFRRAACLLAALCFLPAGHGVAAEERSPVRKGGVVTTRATGAFEVKVEPQPAEEKSGGAAIGRLSLDKQFHGDLEAGSRGQMLAASTATPGSAGYVAIELVTGTLRGRSGTFVLQHSGTMTRSAPQLSVTVVPDSGTGELTGLAGKMTIRITEGKHFYEFEYTLPESGG